MSSYSPEQDLSKNTEDRYFSNYDNKTFKTFDALSRYLKNTYKITYQSYLVNNGLANKEDYLECQECGLLCKSLSNHIISYHKDIDKQLFIDKWKPEKWVCDSTSKILSNMTLGENNSNHKSKTTELQRQQNSPFSKEFYRLRNPELSDGELETKVLEFSKEAHINTINTSSLEYWLIKTNGDEQEAKKLFKQRQTTFSKEICIEKYGEEDGIKRFNQRTEKWIDSTNTSGNMKHGFSQISQELCNKIKEYYPESEYENLFYATHNHEFRLSSFKYDFTDKSRNKIIEFNGDLYHANPKTYKADEHPHPFRTELTSTDLWDIDRRKKEVANNENYDVFVVWESEYKQNKEAMINICLDFLNIKK